MPVKGAQSRPTRLLIRSGHTVNNLDEGHSFDTQ